MANEIVEATQGTIGREDKFGEAFFVHQLEGVIYKTKISTLRGDFQEPDGTISNRVRLWEKGDFKPRPNDSLQKRLYCTQWMRPRQKGSGYEYEFRAVTPDDLHRERIVEDFIAKHLVNWQDQGWIPDMRIEVGGPPRYQGLDLIKARGWTHWHHLFTPLQLLFLGLSRKHIQAIGESEAALNVLFARLVDWSSKLCRYGTGAARESISQTFYNQALNTLFTYGVRPFIFASGYLLEELKRSAIYAPASVVAREAREIATTCDIFVTDPPYGDAVKYEEILDFFIAWLRRPICWASRCWKSCSSARK